MKNLTLRVLSPEDAATVTVGWDLPAGAQYCLFYADGVLVSNAPAFSRAGQAKTQVRFDASTKRFQVAIVTRDALDAFDVAVGTWQRVPSQRGIVAPAWRFVNELGQTSEGPYTFGWIKDLIPAPGFDAHWSKENLIQFKDFPDKFVMFEAKRFVSGYPGAVTNFHLVGGDEISDGTSPVRLDYRDHVSSDWPPGVVPGLVITNQAELNEGRKENGVLLVATDAEVKANRAATWTFEWEIVWRQNRTGSISLKVYLDGVFWREIKVSRILTAYPDQRPMVYCWQGQYESTGKFRAEGYSTLCFRGRTRDEALAMRPVFGSIEHSTGPRVSSSVTPDGTLLINPGL